MPRNPLLSEQLRYKKEREKQIPSAIRFYKEAVLANMTGRRDRFNAKPFTEADFTKGEIEAIRAAIKKAKSEGRNYIEYGDYPTREPWHEDRGSIGGEINAIYNDPARSAMFTLGMARFDNNGVVYDTYDFAARPDAKVGVGDIVGAMGATITGQNPRAVFNLIGNISGLRSGTGRKIVVNTNVDRD